MGKHYYYEAEYRCDCEVCGKQFRGVIRRGPLEYAGGVIPTGIGAAVDAADMKLSKQLIQSRIDGIGNQPFEAVNADKCPHCGARQSWYPMARPVKPGGIGGYLLAAFAGMVLGLIIWLLFFFDAVVPFVLLLAAGGLLGVFLVYQSRRKNGQEEMNTYLNLKKEYDAFQESLASRTARNKPEVLWETARRTPCDF